MNIDDINTDLLSINAFNYLHDNGYWNGKNAEKYLESELKKIEKLEEFDVNIRAKQYACLSGDRRILLNN